MIEGAYLDFGWEYPCHSPIEKRWFLLNGTRFVIGNRVRVALSHQNITKRKAAEEALSIIVPLMGGSDTASFAGTVVLGTVEGDIHDLGKTIVYAMLSGAGFKVYDIGINVPAAKFAEKAIEVNADIIAASALLTTTVPRLEDVQKALVNAGIRDKVKTMAGGAAVTERYTQSINFDGYGKEGYDAVILAKKFMGIK